MDDDGAGAHSAVVSRFSYDGWNPAKPPPVGTENFDIWGVLDGSSSLTSRNLQGDKVDQPLARIDGAAAYWALPDHLGSIRKVIDNSGVVKDAIVYDAFGNIVSETDSTKRGMYSWTGREIDVETGLQYNRARYYDPVTARWISQDPLGFDAGDSNVYRYVNNAVAAKVDPSGMDFILVVGRSVGTFILNKLQKVEGGHYAIEYYKAEKDFKFKGQFAGFNDWNPYVMGMKEANLKLERMSTLELTYTDGWYVFKTVGKGTPALFPVQISSINYDKFNAFDVMKPVRDSNNIYNSQPLMMVWNSILKTAKAYPFAEQPGWDNDPTGANIKNFPNSRYIIPPQSGAAAAAFWLNPLSSWNNSNTFVHQMLLKNNLPDVNFSFGGFVAGLNRQYSGNINPDPLIVAVPKGETWTRPFTILGLAQTLAQTIYNAIGIVVGRRN